MESTETVFGKHSTFTSNQDNMIVTGATAKYTEGFTLTLNALQAGSSAMTIANVLGMVNPIQISVGGVIQITTRAVDLYALDKLVYGINPLTVIGAGDNQETMMSGLWLPAWFPPVNETTTASLGYNAVTNADNTELSLTALYLNGIPRRETLHYTEFSKPTSGIDDTSLNNWSQDINLVGNLTGVLFFTETPTTASTLMERGTIQQIAIDVDGTERENWEFHEIPAVPKIFAGQAYDTLEASPGTTAILDNYNYLPINREPVPKGARVRIRAMAGITAETIRTLPIQQIPY